MVGDAGQEDNGQGMDGGDGLHSVLENVQTSASSCQDLLLKYYRFRIM